MTVVGIFGLLLSVLALAIGWTQRTSSRLAVIGALLIVHLGASLYYYQYALGAVADAKGYYFDTYNISSTGFAVSTVLVFKLVRFMKIDLGATFLDCFLVFQAVGFAGMMLLVRVFDEIEMNISSSQDRGLLPLLFLPSVNFWTSAIGKDAPLFFAVSLCIWAMLSLKRRILYFILALLVMILFRAHVALMAGAALAAAAFFDARTSLGRKLGLLTVALGGIWFAFGPVKNTLNVDVTSIASVSAFLDTNNSVYATVAGTTSLGSASFPVRIISLLSRPFFFDATGFLGIVASVENLGVMLALIYTIARWRDLMLLMRRVLFIRFCLLFAIVILFSLTLVYYNVGLGLRQRVMTYPMIFSVVVAMWALRKRQAPAKRLPQGQGRLMPQPIRNAALPEV